MERQIASIVHLTDLHLLIDENGHQRDPREIRLSVRGLRASANRIRSKAYRELIEGFALHDNEAWYQLQHQLPQIVRAERRRVGDEVAVIVMQTGDVETFGRRLNPGNEDPYPAFKYLRDEFAPTALAASATAWHDLFGNHDVWAGTFPFLTPFKHADYAFREIPKVSQLKGPWPDRIDIDAPSGFHLELYRVNSVAPDALHNSPASGIIAAHPPGTLLPRSRSWSPFDELDALAKEARLRADGTASRPIRIAAIHHPPHFFPPNGKERLTTGRMIGKERLAECACALPIHLVLAGHRHRLNPDLGVSYDGGSTTENQEPLPSRTGQLVAESPTLSFDLTRQRGRNAFALYRLFADVASDRLRVSRVRFAYHDLTGFGATAERDVFRNIPLDQ